MRLTPTLEDALSQLVKILRHEKEQLLSGQYAQLEDISRLKAKHLKTVNDYISNENNAPYLAQFAPAINKVKSLAMENEKLLQSAKYGVNSAKTRLENIKNSESIVGTYTPDGDKLRTQSASTTRYRIA